MRKTSSLLWPLLLCLALHAAVLQGSIHSGMSLTDALLQLQRDGLRLVFTSEIVRPEMKVSAVPKSRNPRAIVSALLAPHNLDVDEGPNGVLIVVRSRKAAPAPSVTRPKLTVAEEIIVHPPDGAAAGPEPRPSTTLTGQEIETLPHLGNDAFRALTLLPGTASADTSAQLQIRGGRRDELLIRLDGQELYEPYHLRDYDSALSVISASRVSKINLMTALPASYGDRMSGVLDMVTTAPSAQPMLRIGISLLDVEAQAADVSPKGRLGWSASFRRGSTDLIGRTLGTEAPSFSDLFAKVDYQITRRQSLRFHDLASIDELNYADQDDGKRLDTEYVGHYVWLSHRVMFSNALYVDSAISRVRLDRERGGAELDDERRFDVLDKRVLNVTSMSQQWNFQRSKAHQINAGLEYEKFDALYDYSSYREFHTPLARLRTDGHHGVFAFNDRFEREDLSIYATDRIRIGDRMTVDAGLRHDSYSELADKGVVNPRLSAAWAVGSNVVHIGWGKYSQSQRAYELMIDDGDSRFHPAEHSRQWVAGVEHVFGRESRIPLELLRAELYGRTIANPRPRYRNLFDSFDPFPEGQFDRVRVEPQRATSHGIELFVRGRTSPRIAWWANYSLAAARDRIDGREVRRETDQTHTVNADLNYAASRNWNLNLAWTYRTGWPTTPLTISEKDGELVPLLGSINSQRLPSYHRLDLRVSREWKISAGTLMFFVDGRNLYDRRNVAGFDVKLDRETATLIKEPERWPGIFASLGVVWRSR